MTKDIDDRTRIEELEADNARLRRLLDQRHAPAELRHRLRTTISLLRAIIKRSAATERDREQFVAHLEDRLDTIGRAQSAADNLGVIGLIGILTDELLVYGASEGERLVLNGPDIEFQPKSGQVFALAIHELAVNAVEHGSLGSGRGRLEITWTLSEEAIPAMTFVWKEYVSAAPREPDHWGFGTEVLHKVLAYELNAKTEMVFEPDGVRCTISFPLEKAVGEVSEHRNAHSNA